MSRNIRKKTPRRGFKNFRKFKKRYKLPGRVIGGRRILFSKTVFIKDLTPKSDKERKALKKAKKEFKEGSPNHKLEIIAKFTCI